MADENLRSANILRIAIMQKGNNFFGALPSPRMIFFFLSIDLFIRRAVIHSCAPARDKDFHVFVTEVASSPRQQCAREIRFHERYNAIRDISRCHASCRFYPSLPSSSRCLGRALSHRRRLHSFLHRHCYRRLIFVNGP